MMRTFYEAPDPSVLFYQRTDDNGKTEIATIQSLRTDLNGSWRALFKVPGQADILLDQYSSELMLWEPVFALTQSDISTLVERVAQRVTELMQDRPQSETVIAAMGVLGSNSVQEAIDKAVEAVPAVDPFEMLSFSCGCGKAYKYEKSYKKHKKKCKAQEMTNGNTREQERC